MAVIVTQVNDLFVRKTHVRADAVFQVVPRIVMVPIVLTRVRVRVAIDSRVFAIVMELIVIKVSCPYLGNSTQQWTRERG